MSHDNLGSSGAHETVTPDYDHDEDYATQETGKSSTVWFRSRYILTSDTQITASKTCQTIPPSVLTIRSLLVYR